MAFCDSFLFHNLKETSKGKRFDNVETYEYDATELLLVIKKTEFKKCFQHWQESWNVCTCRYMCVCMYTCA